MNIEKIGDPNKKGEICNSILRSLPDWFGLEAAIVQYIKGVQLMDTWVVFENQQAIGFATTKRHFSQSTEVHVMSTIPACFW